MIKISLEKVASAVNGDLQLNGATAGDTVSGFAQTDSREINPGDIFFARKGEETDGFLFIDKAVANGAALVIAEKNTVAEVPVILVDDATEALGKLAAHNVRVAIDIFGLKTIAITGSNGKTTTKNLVAKMLQTIGNTVASEKSFNNEVGGPLTALRVDEDTRYLVAEMGASGPGEIKRLVEIVPPMIAVVLKVGMAHVGEFGGIETTFKTKSEMVTDLPDSALAILNIEDPMVKQMKELTKAKVKWFGLGSDADVWAEDIAVSASGTKFKICSLDKSFNVNFPVLGEHHVLNALAATAIALELGVSLEEAVRVLEETTRPAKWRMEVFNLKNEITLINDAYNASPDSMQAALKTLRQVTAPDGRSFAVLGAMSELGESAGQEHDRIGIHAVRLRIDQLVIVGKDARRMHISAINEGAWDSESVFFETFEEAKDYLLKNLRPKDTVLFKSSNSAKLRLLGDDVKEALS